MRVRSLREFREMAISGEAESKAEFARSITQLSPVISDRTSFPSEIYWQYQKTGDWLGQPATYKKNRKNPRNSKNLPEGFLFGYKGLIFNNLRRITRIAPLRKQPKCLWD